MGNLLLFCILFYFLIEVIFWNRGLNTLVVIKYIFPDVHQEIWWRVRFVISLDEPSEIFIKDVIFYFLAREFEYFFRIWFGSYAVIKADPLRFLAVGGNVGKNEIMAIVRRRSLVYDYWVKCVVTIRIVIVVSWSSNDEAKI